jgi:2-iminobutanoate/2-iminopropanoate deaminase
LFKKKYNVILNLIKGEKYESNSNKRCSCRHRTIFSGDGFRKYSFLSGQILLSAESGEISGSSIIEQTEQVIQNIKAVLEAAGSSITKVVKTTCFLAGMNDFAAFNEVYAKHFTGKPARSTVAVKQLPRSVLVEVEVVAEI